MNQRYEDLVEEGLAAITSGRTDLDSFLAGHPVEAAELRPVLEAAVAVERAVDVQPRPAFRYTARADFADRIQARSRGSWLSGWLFAMRPVAVGLFAVMVATSLAAGGAVAASTDATPESPLYSVKIAQESVRLAIARDELERADLKARFAERRVDELGRVSGESPPDQRAHLAQEIAENLQAIARAVQREREQGNVSPETRAKLNRLARQLESSRLRDPELLRRVLAATPAEHRPLITRLIQQAQEENQRTLRNLDVEPGNPVRPAPDPPSAPERRVPNAGPTPVQRASDARLTPGQGAAPARPTPERTGPAARLAPDDGPLRDRQALTPGAPGVRPTSVQTLQERPSEADQAATDASGVPDQTMPNAQVTANGTSIDPHPTPGQVVADAQPTPEPTATGARLIPDQTATPQLRPTLGQSTTDARLPPSPTAREARPTPAPTAPPTRLTPERVPALATAPTTRQ